MIIVERMITEHYPGKFADLVELDKRYDAVEKTIGYPPKKRYWSISSPHNSNTTILERRWESMAAMEAAYEKSFTNADIQALEVEGTSIIKFVRFELYTPAE